MKVKITVLLTPDEFARLDAYCKKRGYKKSTLLARLAREHMNDQGFQPQMTMFEESGVASPRRNEEGGT